MALPKLREPRPIDYDLDKVVLHGRNGGGALNVEGSILGADLELTIEGASTLTIAVEDPKLALLRSKLITAWTWGENDLGTAETWVRKGRAVDVNLGGLWFRLVKVSKASTTLTLTFEDRIVNLLRRHKGAKKANRAHTTRAEFIYSLVREVKAERIVFYCPELHKRQPIAKKSDRVTTAQRRAAAQKGLNGSSLKVKGQDATDAQASILERALDVADQEHAPHRATLALIVAIIQESGAQNLSGGDRDSAGALQVRASTARGMGLNNRDPEACFRAFLKRGFWGRGGAIELARKNPSMPADWIAQQAQGSAYPRAYHAWLDEGRAAIDSYHGGGGRVSVNVEYDYTRGAKEDSWTAGQRLATEVNWRLFARQGALWFISEEDLFRQRPELRLVEGDDGVDVLDWDLDLDAVDEVAEVRVTARSSTWTAWPGMVVLIAGQGPADGRYIVASVRRSLVDRSGKVDVTVKRPIPERPEPANDTKEKDTGGGSSGAKHDDVYRAAMHISGQNRPYVYGGGHGEPLSQISAHEGLDCSSSTSLALKAGGMLDANMALVSGAFARAWGEPGKGRYLTVWANDEHVFIEFTDRMHKRFDTSPHGVGPSGPHVRDWGSRSTRGFTPRHWPGT